MADAIPVMKKSKPEDATPPVVVEAPQTNGHTPIKTPNMPVFTGEGVHVATRK